MKTDLLFALRTLNNLSHRSMAKADQLSTINGLDCRQNSGVVFEIKFLALANRATILRELQCALLR